MGGQTRIVLRFRAVVGTGRTKEKMSRSADGGGVNFIAGA